MTARFLQSIVVLCCACMVAPLSAQESSTDKPKPDRNAAIEAASTGINLDFPGGTAEQYVDAIRKSAGDANIVSVAALDSIAMPPVRLRNVIPFTALTQLEHLPRAQPGRQVKIDVTNSGGVITIGADVINLRDMPKDSLVLSVGDVLESNLKPADLLTAVESALEMFKSTADPAQIRFHEATGLIIARGTGEQMSAISEVVQQLRDRRERAMQQSRFTLESRLTELQVRVNTLSDELAQASRRATEYQTRNEILEKELDRMRAQLNLKPQ